MKWSPCEFPPDKCLPCIDGFTVGQFVPGKLCILGGVMMNNDLITVNSAVYKLDLDAMTCEPVEGALPFLQPRIWLSSTQIGSKMYIFGGRTYTPPFQYFNDIVTFDTGSYPFPNPLGLHNNPIQV
jgi:hypothetical protein